jgi:hypothetical protein
MPCRERWWRRRARGSIPVAEPKNRRCSDGL